MASTREGNFTIDAVAAMARRWLLDPRLAVPVAVGLRWEPVWSHLLSHLPLRSAAWLRRTAALLAAASVALAVNDHLDARFANNWVEDSTWDWDREIVVVTGGSSGIGAAIVQRLVARNAQTRVVVVDSQPLRWSPPDAASITYYQCDLGDSSAIRAVCARIRRDVGHPTVLFNNAGLARGYTVVDGGYADVETTVRVNLIAPFLMAKEFLPEMVRRDHGHIINTGSLSSLIPPADLVDYSATKAGLTSLHEGLQLELKHRHHAPRVRLTLAILGYIKTPLFTGSINMRHFIFPLLDVESVSERLVNAAYSGYGTIIYMPQIARYIASLKGGPEWLFRLVRDQTLRSRLDFRATDKSMTHSTPSSSVAQQG